MILEWKEPNWSNLDTPDPAPQPFKILFVDVNDNEQLNLKLKEEYEKMKDKLSRHFSWNVAEQDKPRLITIPYSTWDEFLTEIRREYPAAVQFGLHSQESGIELFQQSVQPHQMLQAIEAHNRHARYMGRTELRYLFFNACESAAHAEKLSEGVDFAIGHFAPVPDHLAIKFTDTFYDCFFDNMPLLDSFRLAKSASSNGYALYAKRTQANFD